VLLRERRTRCRRATPRAMIRPSCLGLSVVVGVAFLRAGDGASPRERPPVAVAVV